MIDPNDHQCIDEEIDDMLKAMAHEDAPPEILVLEQEDSFMARHSYKALEEKILIAVIGFVNGRGSAQHNTPEPMLLDALSDIICPRCMLLWAQYTGGCCFPHTLSKLITMANKSISLEEVDRSEIPCSTPEGNQLN